MVTCPLMHDLWVNILSAWQAQSTLEMVAVVAAILYLVLAIRENIWCWLFAFISTGLFIYLYHSVSLFSESLLNVFYLAMAVYGWRQWSQGETNNHHKPIIKWSWQKHLQLILLTGLCVPVLGFSMQSVGADYAYWDAFTTCFAVSTTFLVVWKVLENWYYWLVINSVSAVLCWLKGLELITALHVLYLVMTVFGIMAWHKSYHQRHDQRHAQLA